MHSGNISHRRLGRRGFTLVELLTVIAIIAVLAGILFPSFNVAKAKARRASCRGNLQTIAMGLRMYKDDFDTYPEVLYARAITAGFSILAGGVPRPGVEYRLFPGYVASRSKFTCPESLVRPPAGDKPYDARCDPADPQAAAFCEDFNRQPINQVSLAMGGPPLVLENRFPAPLRMPFYPAFDSYDFQFRPNDLAAQPELRYSRKWTPLSANPPGIWDKALVPARVEARQLLYPRAPDSSVVTWCLYHTKMDAAGTPRRGNIALVLFLDGRVHSKPADEMVNYADSVPGLLPDLDLTWRILPNP